MEPYWGLIPFFLGSFISVFVYRKWIQYNTCKGFEIIGLRGLDATRFKRVHL